MLGIAVTRAFGDHRWKWDNEFIKAVQHKFWGTAPRPGSKSPPYMTAEPEITETEVVRREPGDGKGKSDFMILASDGTWPPESEVGDPSNRIRSCWPIHLSSLPHFPPSTLVLPSTLNKAKK
jgi:serine/threonine protein phosphatase PrpC